VASHDAGRGDGVPRRRCGRLAPAAVAGRAAGVAVLRRRPDARMALRAVTVLLRRRVAAIVVVPVVGAARASDAGVARGRIGASGSAAGTGTERGRHTGPPPRRRSVEGCIRRRGERGSLGF
jgi:hypothetical protein